MKKLTVYQIEYLLSMFFQYNTIACGWRSVATKLLKNGSCIVAGNECIWTGGIGNYIHTQTADNLIGCLEYSFDLNGFLYSGFFLETKQDTLRDLEKEIHNITNNRNEILNLEL